LSRIGKRPIPIPNGVEVKLDGSRITVKGAKGTLSWTVPSQVNVSIDDSVVTCTVNDMTKESKSRWGLARVLINNMIVGVADGYRKDLEIVGVGYKAEMKGKNLTLAVGLSHSVEIEPETGITISTDGPTKVVIEGADKEAVGRTASEIRQIRPPEPYNGKGIRYAGENILRKAGKAAGK
jgi:large subunit ribosomal protein L6